MLERAPGGGWTSDNGTFCYQEIYEPLEIKASGKTRPRLDKRYMIRAKGESLAASQNFMKSPSRHPHRHQPPVAGVGAPIHDSTTLI